MHRTRITAALLIVASAGLALLAWSCTSNAPSTTATPQEDPVARGRYLTTIMSCGDCHTPGSFYGGPDTTRRLAGSDVGWIGPWGVVHARNLTPDTTTGIGKWTAEQIVTSLKTGRTPDGVQLAPIMPSMNYSGTLTQDDAMAIAAYLKSLPPIVHKNLDRIPPGAKLTGNNILFPPPPAWDAPPPAAGGGAK